MGLMEGLRRQKLAVGEGGATPGGRRTTQLGQAHCLPGQQRAVQALVGNALGGLFAGREALGPLAGRAQAL